MRPLVACLLLVTMASSVAMADIVPGKYDSQFGEFVCSYWEDNSSVKEPFVAGGLVDGKIQQWTLKASLAGEDIYDYGRLTLNTGKTPWSGDNQEEVLGYSGDILKMIVEKKWDKDTLFMTVTGTAILDDLYMTSGDIKEMKPVGVDFVMGFKGVPKIGDKGELSGTPDYVIFTVAPEPSSILLLGIGAISLAAYARRRRAA